MSERLRTAVETLKTLAHADWSNVIVRSSEQSGVIPFGTDDRGIEWGLGGALPDFHPTAAGYSYGLDAYGTAIAHFDPQWNGDASDPDAKRFTIYRLDTPDKGGAVEPRWVDDASFLWASGCKSTGSSGYSVWPGCGDMNALLHGDRTDLRATRFDYWTEEEAHEFNDCRTYETLYWQKMTDYGKNPTAVDNELVSVTTTGWDDGDLEFVKVCGHFKRVGTKQKWKRVGDESVPWYNVLDALELACAAEHVDVGGCEMLRREPPSIGSMQDLPKLAGMLTCAADRAEYTLEKMYLAEVPKQLVDDMKRNYFSGSFPAYRGEYGETIAQLGGAVQQLVVNHHAIVQALRNIALDIQMSQAELRALDVQQSIAELEAAYNELDQDREEVAAQIRAKRLTQTMSNLTTQCAVASYQAIPSVSAGIGASVNFSPGAVLAAAATCANVLGVQLPAELEINGLEASADVISKEMHEIVAQKINAGEQLTGIEREKVLLGMAAKFLERSDTIDRAYLGLNEAYANIHAHLAKLEKQRRQAHRLAAKVLLLDNDDLGHEFSVNTAMHARFNTLHARYLRARDEAIRAAYIARRSVEQRLGVDLSTFQDDIGYVEAPATWVDRLCTMKGIDYDKIRSSSSSGGASAGTEGADQGYADEYLGDYVRKLRAVVDSYQRTYGFDDGDDVAVISVRDEIVQARMPADITSPNLLLRSASLRGLPWQPTRTADGLTAAPAATGLEGPFGCEAASGAGVPLSHQAQVCRPGGGAQALALSRAPLQATAVDGSPIESTLPTSTEPMLAQALFIAPGEYWLSWYQRASEPALAVRIDGFDAGAAPVIDAFEPLTGERWVRADWVRHYRSVRIDRGGEYDVGFVAPSTGSVLFAGPQLEAKAHGLSDLPSEFVPTDDDRLVPLGLQEDTSGEAFRSQYWTRGCEHYCPADVPQCGDRDDASDLPSRCYHEVRFSISQDAIEKGYALSQAGFAAGNFNYRFDTVAVNVVGTAVKDCSTSGTPSTCYANNHLQYSLLHTGPFRVRNHAGQTYEAPLFDGRIQQAKALLAERYLTNPLASADRSLIADYVQAQLRGRPLDGNFALRIYDQEGLDWSKVEDIQLVLRYRFWTRTGSTKR